MSTAVQQLQKVYQDFNARRMDAVLAAMDENVTWANGMEGGHVHGREEVRAYWTRQWAMFSPKVEPVDFAEDADGKVTVEVHQVVHDMDGKLVMDGMVGHIFQFEDGLIKRFDIRE